LRSRVSGRSARELLPSETWNSLPLAISSLMLFEGLMPLRYYALLIWCVSLGATAALKGLLMLGEWRRGKKQSEPEENFVSSAIGWLIAWFRSRSLLRHLLLWALAVLFTMLVRWPAVKPPYIPRKGLDAILDSNTILSFELWLAAFYAASVIGAKLAARKGENYAVGLLCPIAIIIILLFPHVKAVPSPWKTVLSMPPAITRPLFGETQNVIRRRVNIWNQTRDAVAIKIPSMLIQDFPDDAPHGINIAYGIMCGGKNPIGGAHFSLTTAGTEIWKNDIACAGLGQHNDWRVSRVEGLRGRVVLKITPSEGERSNEIVGVISAQEFTAPVNARPNIMIILIDTLRADHLGIYGYSRDTSPNIDAIAREGVVFDWAVSQAPHTVPSVAAILTGLYPAHNGVVTVIDDAFNGSVETLGEKLAKAGYTTAGFTATNIVIRFLDLKTRFETFDWRCAPQMNWKSAECLAGRMIPWLQENNPQPFFLYAHFFDPHDTYNAPPPYTEMFCNRQPDNRGLLGGDMRGYTRGFLINFPMVDLSRNDVEYLKCLYDGEIRYADSQIGKIMEQMKALGLLDNTILIITADHGEEFLEHGRLLHGQTLYRELTHVPLILRYPPAVKPGRIRTAVETTDIVPTVLDLAGIQVPPGLDGTSLAPLIRSGDEGQHPRKTFSWADHITYRCVSIQAGNWKFIKTTFPSLKELYDLNQDPNEKNNLAGKYPNLVKAFDDEAQDLLRRKGVPPIIHGLSPTLRDTLRSLGYIR